jgi:hypothetical protein
MRDLVHWLSVDLQEWLFCTAKDAGMSAMAEYVLKEGNLVPSATGVAGPPLRRAYCSRGCYDSDEPIRSCTCKGCYNDAHGRGYDYAFVHGYLKNSPPGFRKSPERQEWLPFPKDLSYQFGRPIHFKTGLIGSGAT